MFFTLCKNNLLLNYHIKWQLLPWPNLLPNIYILNIHPFLLLQSNAYSWGFAYVPWHVSWSTIVSSTVLFSSKPSKCFIVFGLPDKKVRCFLKITHFALNMKKEICTALHGLSVHNFDWIQRGSIDIKRLSSKKGGNTTIAVGIS